MIEVVDNLIFMGIAASVIAVLMLLVAWLGRGVFSGTWYQTAWIIIMLLLVIPVYWLIGGVNVRPETFEGIPLLGSLRDSYVHIMDRSIGEMMGLDSAGNGSAVDRSSSVFDMTIQTLVFLVWGLGVAVLTAWKLIRYYTFRNMIISQSVPSDERWVFAIPEEIRAKIKLRDAAIPSPFVFGIFHPTVVMPAHAENKADICFALMHELLHIERKDLLTKSIAESVAVLHWFNPFAWVIRNKVTLACENACDEAVAAKLNEDGRKGYAMAILDFMDYSAAPEPDYPPTLMSFSGDSDHVKTRLKNIMRYRKMSRAVLVFSVGIILVVVSVGILTGFSLALSVRSVRIEKPEEIIPEVTETTAVPTVTTIQTEEIRPTEPIPEFVVYSDRLTVVSKGDETMVLGAYIYKTVSGRIENSSESVRFSADGTMAAFIATEPFGGRSVLYFSNGRELTIVAGEVSDFALSSDGGVIAYKTDTGPIRFFETSDGETSTVISAAFGHFSMSPGAKSVGYCADAQGRMRVYVRESGQTLSPDIVGNAVALSDAGDIVYFVREENGNPVLLVMREGKTIELLRGGDFSLSKPQRLILEKDRSGAVVLSDGRAVAYIDGRRTLIFDNVSDVLCPEDTVILDRVILDGGFVLLIEERVDGDAEGFPVFAIEETGTTSRGVLVTGEGLSNEIRLSGSVMSFSSDGYRVLFRDREGVLFLKDDAFGEKGSEPVEITGTLTDTENVAFATNRSLYYLSDEGQLLRISETGKPNTIANDVSGFALISTVARTEVFYLADYKEALFDENGTTVKRYGYSLYAAEHRAIGFERRIDDFVLRVQAGDYGVSYERVLQEVYGSSGCIASVDIFYSSNGEDFSKIKEIG